jgi:hypothetical protein
VIRKWRPRKNSHPKYLFLKGKEKERLTMEFLKAKVGKIPAELLRFPRLNLLRKSTTTSPLKFRGEVLSVILRGLKAHLLTSLLNLT